MTTLIDDHRSHVSAATTARYFYFHMALACTAVAFLGFAPTYWLPLASGSFSSTPVVHFHGMLFFAWTLYFAFQTWLAASGRTARHRMMGMVGVSLATAMTIVGFLVAVNAMKRSAAIGQTDQGIAFVIVPLSGIRFFAVVFILAVAATHRPETHKRLMLLAIASGRGGGPLVSHLPGAARTTRPASRRGHHCPGLRRLSVARGGNGVRLAHARSGPSRVHLWRRGACGREAPELADQRHARLACLCRWNIGARSIAGGA